MTQQQVIVSLPKSKETVLYEYERHQASMWVTASLVKNKLRSKQIARAVFRLAREKKWYAHVAEVDTAYKRTGVGSVMYMLVQSEIDGTLVPSDEQSEEAKQFWQHRLLTINKNTV
jgi:hypothetical protein